MTLGLLPNFVNTAALRYFYEVARAMARSVWQPEKIHNRRPSAISRQIQPSRGRSSTPSFSLASRGGLAADSGWPKHCSTA